MGAPDGKYVEVEFTAGVWTDVTDYVDWSAGVSCRFGRSTVFGDVQPGTFSCTLDNRDGRFSPLRQVLTDGVTAHPYWPNVIPRRRIRYGWIMGATRYPRFQGYVVGWPPGFKTVGVARTSISAVDRLSILTGQTMPKSLAAEVLSDQPSYYWPLTDDSGSTSAVEALGGPNLAVFVAGSPGADALQFGQTGPGSGQGTAVQFAPTSSSVFAALSTSKVVVNGAGGFSIEFWINAGSAVPTGYDTAEETVLILRDAYVANPARSLEISIMSVGFLKATINTPSTGEDDAPISLGNLLDNRYHHVVVIVPASGTTITTLVDGIPAGAGSVAGAHSLGQLSSFELGGGSIPGRPFRGLLGQVALYPAALSSDRAVAHNASGRGWLGETVNERLARFLSYGGLTSADWDLGGSDVELTSYPQDGQNVVAGANDLVATEGGGAALWQGPDGRVLFRGRHYRRPGDPTITVDAAGDLDASAWQPAFDADNLVNSSTGSRATATQTTATVTARDEASIAMYQQKTGDFTSYARSDDDVLYNAQQRVASQSRPGFRVDTVPIDLWTAQTPGLYQQVAAAGVGDRLRITNLPANAAPTSSIDVLIEGGSETTTDSSCTVTFDTSPADRPALLVWGGGPYGKWQADGQTLHTAVSRTATTVVIDSPAGAATFTIDASMYPLTVQIGAEHIGLPNPPATSSSPQTFTGAIRGVDGTPPAPQAAGSDVALVQRSTWAL